MKLKAESIRAVSTNWPPPFFSRAEQCHDGAERGIESGDVVGERHRHAGGRPVGIADQVAQATHRLPDHAVARPVL